MDDYQSYDAVGLAALVRDGQVSAEELLAEARGRAHQVNGRINAIVADVDPPPRGDGPLSGVPFLIKDLRQDLEGHATSDGSRSLATTPAKDSATVVKRWLDAGLVIFGKTNTPEIGAKSVTEPHLFGPARNPWNTDHSPGGSSGGSAAAVAAGIVPCAGANDAGGSIRIPASACGLFGLKSSRGLLPFGPLAQEGLGGLATHGVISRSVRDTAAMLDILVGPAPDDPYLVAAHPDTPYSQLLDRKPERLRIGLCTTNSINPHPHPEALAAVDDTGKLLESLGHEVETLETPPCDDATMAEEFLTILFAYAALSVARAKEASGCDDSGFEPDTLVMAALGRASDPVAVISAMENRQVHVRRLARFHESYDLLVTPTTATPPPRIGQFDLPAALKAAQRALLRARAAALLRFTPIMDQLINDNLGWVPYTPLANVTGRPAMSVPLHWTADGLPIGVHFLGRLGSEGVLLQLAAQLERARPWAHRRPPI